MLVLNYETLKTGIFCYFSIKEKDKCETENMRPQRSTFTEN